MALTNILDFHMLPYIVFTAGLATVFLLRFLPKIDSQSAASYPSSPPENEIVSLRVYPVKSCRGLEVKSAQLFRTGLDLDRNWMFISAETREFLTIRTNSNMTLLRTAFDADTDQLSIFTKQHKIQIPAHPISDWLQNNTEITNVRIWGQETDAREYHTSLTQPFSDFLDMDVRLVYKGPTPRVLRGCGAPEFLGRTEATKFADMMPVQVASMSSLGEPNERLVQAGESEVGYRAFSAKYYYSG